MFAVYLKNINSVNQNITAASRQNTPLFQWESMVLQEQRMTKLVTGREDKTG